MKIIDEVLKIHFNELASRYNLKAPILISQYLESEIAEIQNALNFIVYTRTSPATRA